MSAEITRAIGFVLNTNSGHIIQIAPLKHVFSSIFCRDLCMASFSMYDDTLGGHNIYNIKKNETNKTQHFFSGFMYHFIYKIIHFSKTKVPHPAVHQSRSGGGLGSA